MPQRQPFLKALSSIFLLFLSSESTGAFLIHHGVLSSIRLQSSNSAVTDHGNTGTSALYEPPSTSTVDETAVVSAPATGKTKPPITSSRRIEKLHSLEDFSNTIDGAPKDTLVAVKFYGKSCPLCRKVSVKYQKMARFYERAPIRFVEIEKTVHPGLFDALEITTFPYLQLYRNGQCIASHATVSESVFERIVNDTIQQFLGMSPQQWDNFLQAFADPIEKATGNFDSMRKRRDQEVASN